MNDDITNLVVMPGDQSTGALAVYTRSDTSVLYGTDSSTFKLTNFNTGTGAIAYTGQTLDQAYVLDDRGLYGKGLADLGAKAGHPELATVPWALWGHSGGGF